MRNKNRRWLFIWALASSFFHIFQCELAETTNKFLNSTRYENSTELRNLFSPRMDYDQWTPLGRGDPLKNDPTYDYVPPVLERVHYWIEPAMRKPDPPLPGENQKTEILVLGVSSKKPSNADSRRDIYEPYLKYIDGPKFQTNYQRLSRPHYKIPQSYFPSPFYKNKLSEKINFVRNEQRVPYTMLMPPPLPSARPESTTTSSVTLQEANLIYQSSTDWKDEKNYYTESSSHVTWRTPYNEYKKSHKNQTNHNQTFEMSHDVQISGPDVMYKGQVSDGDMEPANKYVNIGKLEAQMAADPPIFIPTIPPPKKPTTLQVMQILQTLQPPPYTTPPPISSPLISLLQKEVTQNMVDSFIANIPKVTTKTYPTTPSPSTTTINSLTTDPLFKHYKQPSEPLRGPMYLIIQGHSKVKTYGPSKQIHGIKIQDFNEIPSSDYKDEFQVKHLHTYKKKNEETSSSRKGRANQFKTLSHVVQTGFGAIDYAKRRNDVQETELVAGFDVAPYTDTTSEVYHKGLVDEGNLARKLKEA